MLFLEVLAYAVTGQVISMRGLGCPVALAPSWCPKKLIQLVLSRRFYILLYPLTWMTMISAGIAPHIATLRYLAAVLLAVYVFAENAVTHGHRDQANVVTAWALAVLPETYAEAVVLGVCVLMMAGSGFAKLLIGGTRDWLAPETLRVYLNEYKDCVPGVGPGSRALCQWCVERDWVLFILNIGTIVFECVLAPLAFVMPPRLRCILVVGSVALHLGICVVQSFGIGLAFIPGLGSYLVGYGVSGRNDVTMFSTEWYLSVSIFVIPMLYMFVTRTILPEDFPLTPWALFAWNSKQYVLLKKHFVSGDTRLVLATDDILMSELSGCSVVDKWGMTSAGHGSEGIATARQRPQHDRTIVFDAWDHIFGQTMVLNPVVRALDFENMPNIWDASAACQQIDIWLRQKQRFFEVTSGFSLVRSYFVRVSGSGKVVDVLAGSSSNAPGGHAGVLQPLLEGDSKRQPNAAS